MWNYVIFMWILYMEFMWIYMKFLILIKLFFEILCEVFFMWGFIIWGIFGYVGNININVYFVLLYLISDRVL